MRKTLRSILLVLLALAVLLPAGALADELAVPEVPELILGQPTAKENGTFSNAKYLDGSAQGKDVKQVWIAGKTDYEVKKTDDGNDFAGYEVTKDIEIPSSYNGKIIYRGVNLYIVNVTDKEDALNLIRSITFPDTATARIFLYAQQEYTTSQKRFIHYNVDNSHFYEYVHDPYYVDGKYTSGVNWRTGYEHAINATLIGRYGYMATISSESENDFILELLLFERGYKEGDNFRHVTGEDIKAKDNVNSVYLGGARYAIDPDKIGALGDNELNPVPDRIAENQHHQAFKSNVDAWYWINGPEQGQKFYDSATFDKEGQIDASNKRLTTDNGTYQYNDENKFTLFPADSKRTDLYSNWNNVINKKSGSFTLTAEGTTATIASPIEPNNSIQTDVNGEIVNEDVLQFYVDSTGNGGYWNDLRANASTAINGWVVEYGDLTNSSNDQQLKLVLKGNGGKFNEDNNGPLDPAQDEYTYIFSYGHGIREDEIDVEPEREHYSFDGWYTDEDCTIPFVELGVSKDAEYPVYAKWTPNTYQITLNTLGVPTNETISSPISHTYDTTTTKLPTLTAVDTTYVFEGWMDVDGNLLTDVEFGPREVTEDVTYYAKWNCNITVEVVWEDNNDAKSLRPTAADNVTLTLNNASETKSLPLVNSEVVFTVPAHQKTSGVWTAINYNLASDPVSPWINKGNYKISSELGSNTGYRLVLSYDEVTLEGLLEWVDGSNAYEKRPDTVTIQALRNDSPITETDVLTNLDAHPTQPDTWVYSISGLPMFVNGTEVSYSVAVPSISEYTVEADAVNQNNFKATLPKLTHTIEVKWVEANGVDELTNPPVTSIVVYYGNATADIQAGGVISSASSWSGMLEIVPDWTKTAVYAASITVPVGFEEATAAIVTADKTTFTLKPTTYSITYVLNGSTENPAKNHSSNPASYDVTDADIVLDNAERTGYVFTGWYTDAALTNMISTIDTAKTQNVTVYAGWTELHDINYQLFGIGKNPDSNPDTFYAGAVTTALAAPTMTAEEADKYTFDGWYLDTAYTQPVTEIDPSKYSEPVFLYARWKIKELKTSAEWMDAYNQDDMRKDTEMVLMPVELSYPLKAADEKTECTFTNLDFTINGKVVDYVLTVKPDKLPGQYYINYLPGQEGTKDNNWKAVLYHNIEKVNFTACIEWQDDDNLYGKRPESVSVQLMAENVPYGDPVTLTAANDWSYTWIVPKFPAVNISARVVAIRYSAQLASSVKDYLYESRMNAAMDVQTFVFICDDKFAPKFITPVQDQHVDVDYMVNCTYAVEAENADHYEWFIDRGDGKGPVSLNAYGKTYTIMRDYEDKKSGSFKLFCVATNRYGSTASPVFHIFHRPPVTGDNNQPVLWMMLVALSGAAVMMLTRKKRKS